MIGLLYPLAEHKGKVIKFLEFYDGIASCMSLQTEWLIFIKGFLLKQIGADVWNVFRDLEIFSRILKLQFPAGMGSHAFFITF